MITKSHNEYNKAIKDFSQAIDLNPNYAKAYENRGIAYSQIREFDLAIQDFTLVISFDVKNADAYLNRAYAYAFNDNYKNAQQDVKKCVELGGKVDQELLEILRSRPGKK